MSLSLNAPLAAAVHLQAVIAHSYLEDRATVLSATTPRGLELLRQLDDDLSCARVLQTVDRPRSSGSTATQVMLLPYDLDTGRAFFGDDVIPLEGGHDGQRHAIGIDVDAVTRRGRERELQQWRPGRRWHIVEVRELSESTS